MRARAFKVYDRVRWNTLYHEEQGLFLLRKHPNQKGMLLTGP
jgi:hypothetical protein